MQNEIKNILKEYDLRNTSCREEILDLFLQRNFALSHADIESTIHEDFDRVTVYRTLKTFLDKGLIHKVLDDEGVTKYALCKEKCSHTEHHHEHVHFKCMTCGLTNCLDSVLIPSISLPAGYSLSETSLLVQGTCQDCNQKRK
ncbi:transcriptional repressor [Rhodocytophaga rosea]|uniref:Transcriptional repressor n=1 Tax=Rhodocytophaga rosea TaxID=2704465 RepID=A0A6C0GE32_9BACT|nr:transcriptional repressor [Rhodocytophaga rosea]QHT66043.1 transcriptional repressor [Rhodocytophaga rosea]